MPKKNYPYLNEYNSQINKDNFESIYVLFSYKATSKIVNPAMNWVKGIKSVLEQPNKILNQDLNILYIFKISVTCVTLQYHSFIIYRDELAFVGVALV